MKAARLTTPRAHPRRTIQPRPPPDSRIGPNRSFNGRRKGPEPGLLGPWPNQGSGTGPEQGLGSWPGQGPEAGILGPWPNQKHGARKIPPDFPEPGTRRIMGPGPEDGFLGQRPGMGPTPEVFGPETQGSDLMGLVKQGLIAAQELKQGGNAAIPKVAAQQAQTWLSQFGFPGIPDFFGANEGPRGPGGPGRRRFWNI